LDFRRNNPASETDEQRDKDVNYGIDKDF